MEAFIFDLSILLVVAAGLTFIAVLLKQPIIIAYVLAGVLIGPWGFGLIKHIEFIETVSHIGITLLLFLAGLCLHPQKLLMLFHRTTIVTFVNCICSFLIAFSVAHLFAFNMTDSVYIGLALMFSSTILVIKLLPTTRLHHEHMGAVCIGVLILQDLLAVAVLAFLRVQNTPGVVFVNFVVLSLKLVVFIVVLGLFEQFVLRYIMRLVDRLHEALFIIGLAWCFGIGAISQHMGLFAETGAFFAGVVLARQPISLFISEKLKPLRDFFLVLFFFSLGADLDLLVLKDILIPAVVMAALFIMVKPVIFGLSFKLTGETTTFATETGIRLGQLSEFALLIALLAFRLGHISSSAAQLIELVTIFTFIVSSYIVVYLFPTPIGTFKKLIRD